MNKFGKAIVKLRVPILIISILLLIPAAIGFLKTRVNYDVLSYLPKDIETMKGQDILADDFGTGAFSLCLVEGMDDKDVVKLKKQMEQVDNVDSVIWYDSIMDIAIPDEILPKDIREAYRNDDCTMMAIIFKTTMSSDETMEAITQIRKLASKQCFISGMSAVVTDTKDLCDKEVPIYVTIAVILSLIGYIDCLLTLLKHLPHIISQLLRCHLHTTLCPFNDNPTDPICKEPGKYAAFLVFQMRFLV